MMAKIAHSKSYRRSLTMILLAFLASSSLIATNSGPTVSAKPGVTSGPTLSLNAGAGRHPISPDIYGMNFFGAPAADFAALSKEIRLPVNRWGGNVTSRYNWQTNSFNSGLDYFFEGNPNTDNDPALGQPAESDDFIVGNRANGIKSIITLPMIGYVSKSRTEHLCGFSVAKYGPQVAVSPNNPDCGNGTLTNGNLVINNNPLDSSIVAGPAFVQNWVTHLVSQYGNAANGGVNYYQLDNEPSDWKETHRDVHPAALTYNELRDRTYQYGAAAKAGDPTAKTLGPSNFGYGVYADSLVDGDKAAHGGIGFSEWYLQQMQAYETAHGTRILDYFDQHYYPAQDGVTLSPAGSPATQQLRLRSTRSLWDSTYIDESWIGQSGFGPVRLIPQFREWVNANYPGTKVAVSEYNFGGLESLNGALTQADVLGIFGREQLDLATLWEPPRSNQPGAYAFRMYRNYDGAGGSYGDTWVQASSRDQSQLALYGAQRSTDGALTLMVINKTSSDLTSPLALSGFGAASRAGVYRYSAANLNAIVRQPDVSVSNSGFTTTYPANSITLIVLAKGGATLTVTAATDDGTGNDPGNGTFTLSQALKGAKEYDTISVRVSGKVINLTGPLLPAFKPQLTLDAGGCNTSPTVINFNNQPGLALPGGTTLQNLQLNGMNGPGIRNVGTDNILMCTSVHK